MTIAIVMLDKSRPFVTRVKGLPQAREMWDWLTSLGYEGDPRP
jgi:hypothetical protein